MFAKIVGGSPEHPTVMQVTPEEMRKAVWTVSRSTRPGYQRTSGVGLAIIGAEERSGPGATPWIAGGILVGLAVALKATEKRFA
jgi:hypothetical protein